MSLSFRWKLTYEHLISYQQTLANWMDLFMQLKEKKKNNQTKLSHAGFD